MKNYLFPLFLFATVGATAQPTFTASNFNPVVGETFNYYGFDTTSIVIGLTGPGVTWNYGGLTGMGASTTSAPVVAASSTPYASSFATSNIAYTDASSTAYNYYLMNASGQYQYGEASSSQVVSQSDPGTLYTFPFTYLFSSGDSLHATFTTGGYPATRKGKITTNADGYGTLVLPTGTYNNVLRVKQTWIYLETIDYGFTTASTTFKFEYYYWLRPNTHYPLLTYLRSKIINPFTTIGTSMGTFIDPLSVGIMDEDSRQIHVNVYPNPVTNENVNVDCSSVDGGPVTVALLNIAGQEIISNKHQAIPGNNRFMLGVSGLAPGIYLVEVQSMAGKTRQKLVIE